MTKSISPAANAGLPAIDRRSLFPKFQSASGVRGGVILLRRRLRRWPDRLALVAAERRDGGLEVDAVEMLHHVDHVAASSAASAIPDLLLHIDRKTIAAAA